MKSVIDSPQKIPLSLDTSKVNRLQFRENIDMAVLKKFKQLKMKALCIYQILKGDFMGRFANQGQLSEDNKVSDAIHVLKSDDGYVTVLKLHDLPGVDDFDLTNGNKDLWIKTDDEQTTKKLLQELSSLVSYIQENMLIKRVKRELDQERSTETTKSRDLSTESNFYE